jgi:hypothetical protein
MARRPSLLLLLLAAAAAAVVLGAGPAAAAAPAAAASKTPSSTSACVVTLAIDPKQSPFTLVGKVTKPFNATVTPVKATAKGNIYLRLPADAAGTAAGPCPAATVWSDADAAADLLSRAQLVQPQGKPGVELLPEKITAKVLSDESGDQLATYALSKFSYGLEGNGPLGGVVASPAAASPSAVDASGSTDAEVVVLGGGLVIDSLLTGERTADLEGVAQNVTFASGAAPVGAGGLGVKLEGVKWSLAVSPKTTPGILLTDAKVGIEGNIVASAAAGGLAKAAAEVSTKDLRLRCSSRALAPVIEGGDEAKADLLKRQKRVSGGCPDGGADAPVKAAAAEEAAAAPAAGKEGELSEVDKAVLQAYGSGAASQVVRSGALAAAALAAVAVMVVA